MRMIDPPSRLSGRALWTVKTAPFTLTPKTRSNACSVARKQRDRGPPRINPVAAAYRARDAPATVRVRRRRLAGGSLAGKDSSSSSSSFSSGFGCDSLGADFRGSFIPAAPWVPRDLIGLKLQRP
jgi:hypothetical protein